MRTLEQRIKQRECSKRWRKKHPDKVNAWSKAWQKKNREKVNRWRRNWCQRNKERVSTYRKEYNRTHPEFYAEQKRKNAIRAREFRKQNPELAKERRHNSYMKNREKWGYKGEIAPAGQGWAFIRLRVLARDNCVCRVCGKETKEVHHLDGTGSNRPAKESNHSMDNLITVCHNCHVLLDLLRKGKAGFSSGKWSEEKERNAQIIELSKKHSQTAISKKYGITRQRVNQIIGNWAKKEQSRVIHT